MPEGVCCEAPCAFRTYNKYREKKDGTYELSNLPRAGGNRGTCRHGTTIQIGQHRVCLSFEPWERLLEVGKKKPTSQDKNARRDPT